MKVHLRTENKTLYQLLNIFITVGQKIDIYIFFIDLDKNIHKGLASDGESKSVPIPKFLSTVGLKINFLRFFYNKNIIIFNDKNAHNIIIFLTDFKNNRQKRGKKKTKRKIGKKKEKEAVRKD